MVRHRGIVPVDTNVILEAHRTGSWRALTGGYAVETVEDCVTETQKGFQRRQPKHPGELPGAWPGSRTGVQGRGRGVRRRRGTDWGRNSSAWRQRLPRRTRRSSFAVTRAGSPPERALVSVTAVPISNLVRAARLVGLEVLAELDPDDDYALDEELLALHREMASPTLYATMPTRESFERLLGLWRAYQRGERPEEGHAPWTRLFAAANAAAIDNGRRQIRARLRAPRAVRHRRPVQVPARLKHRLHPEAKSAEVLRWK